MFQFKVQIVLPFTPLTNSQWKTIYEGEVHDIRVAQFEANREIKNVRENPAQYGFPLGVRAVVADEIILNESLWTWPNWPKAKA
jgi:hypothetical protein